MTFAPYEIPTSQDVIVRKNVLSYGAYQESKSLNVL
jgi:hypothetical protein